MWEDFNDFELASLAGEYGLQDHLIFSNDLSLANREEIECMLTEVEYDLAFPQDAFDFNSELAYN